VVGVDYLSVEKFRTLARRRTTCCSAPAIVIEG
jgi:hypothetical protein